MHILRRYIAGVAVLSSTLFAPHSSHAQDSRWICVDRRPEVAVYVDGWRIEKVSNSTIHVWTKWEFSTRQQLVNVTFDRMITHVMIDCRHIRTFDTERVFYSGDSLKIGFTDVETEWVTPPPQTIAETLIIRSCLISAGKPIDSVP